MKKLRALFEKHREVLLYLIFGGLTTVVSVVSFWLLCAPLGMNVLVANVISWIWAVAFAYFTNARWVFRARPSTRGAAARQLLSFYAGRLATLGVEEGLLLGFVTWLGMNEMAVKLIAQVVVIVLNYVISKLLIFRRKEP